MKKKKRIFFKPSHPRRLYQGEVKNKEEKCKQLQRKTDRQNVKSANSYRERQTECKKCKQLQRKTERQNVK